MSRLIARHDRNAWVRRRAFGLFVAKPGVFSNCCPIHTGALSLSSLSVGEMIDFGRTGAEA